MYNGKSQKEDESIYWLEAESLKDINKTVINDGT
jgi:hypothetical protein